MSSKSTWNKPSRVYHDQDTQSNYHQATFVDKKYRLQHYQQKYNLAGTGPCTSTMVGFILFPQMLFAPHVKDVYIKYLFSSSFGLKPCCDNGQ